MRGILSCIVLAMPLASVLGACDETAAAGDASVTKPDAGDAASAPDAADAGATAPDAGDAGATVPDAGPDGGGCFSMAGRTVAIVDVDVIGGVIYPDLALGPDDRPWLVFTKGTATTRFAAVSEFDGAAWSAPDPVEQQDATFLGKRPSIAVDSASTVHVVAYDEDGCRLRYSSKPSGGAWATTALYLDRVDAGDHSNLVLDAAGVLHTTFTEYGTYRIIYGVKAGGGWQFEPVGPGDGATAASSSLVLDAAGQPHVAFYTGTPDEMLRHAHKTGGGWVVSDSDTASESGHYPSLALDPTGAPLIAALRWSDPSEVRLATRTSNGWQAAVVDSGLGITYTTGLAVLPCGATLVAYARNEGTGTQGLWLAHRNPGAADWTRTSLDARTYVSGIDLVVAADGQVHVVYLDETNFVLKHARL